MITEQALKGRLQNISRETNLPFNACWKQLLLERFLVRLAHSGHVDKFIFKGGFLLSYLMKLGRETTDLDFLLTRMRAEENELQDKLQQIIAITSDDGFIFGFDSIEPLAQPHMNYPGYRISLTARFAKMKDKIKIDVGVGDVVEPLIQEIQLVHYRGKPIFEKAISLLAYSAETIFAEKLESVISRGPNNSRMKDYHDLILLIRNQKIMEGDHLKSAVGKTFANRNTKVQPIEFEEAALHILQKLWSAYLKGLGNVAHDLALPKDIFFAIQEINLYLSLKHHEFSKVKSSKIRQQLDDFRVL